MSLKGLLDHIRALKGKWIDRESIPGNLTQYPENTKKLPKQQLIIGLDFGSAFTKVVIGDENNRVHYAVPFHQYTIKKQRYSLPGTLSLMENGEYCLGRN